MTTRQEMSIEDRARLFAFAAHAGQKYGDRPYTDHLEDVVIRIKTFYGPVDYELAAAGYLHDVLEDTKVDKDLLSRFFPFDVVGIVCAVTDRPGKNRHERHERTYPYMRQDGGDRAVILKLADRISNIEAALWGETSKRGLLDMYRKEMPYFEKTVRLPDKFGPSGDPIFDYETRMWEHLKGLLNEEL